MNIKGFMKTSSSVTLRVIRVCVNASGKESGKSWMILMTEQNTLEKLLEDWTCEVAAVHGQVETFG